MLGRKTIGNASRTFLFVALTALLSCGEKSEKGKNGIITGYVVAEQKAGLSPDTFIPFGNGNELKPVPGAKVKVENVEVKKEGRADEIGKFEIEVPRGHYNLIAERVRQDGKKFNALIEVDVEEGKVVDLGQVVIKEAGAIYGVARLSDKSPGYYKGIVVYIMATGMFALTDENGAYAFPGVPSGTYALRFDMVGYKEKKVEGIVVESGKATKVDDVILDVDEQEIINKGIVGGTVKDAQTSSPISGALISVKGLGVSSVSLDDGRYQMAIDPGTYKLLAVADGYKMAEIEVKVVAGKSIHADIILNPSSEYGIATLKGKIIDGTNGNPVFSAVVLSSPSRGQTYTDTDGTFSLNLPCGCYTIIFAKGGYEETKLSLCLDSGMNVDLGNIALYLSGGGCFAETEVCDGKDNDCDGEVDDECWGDTTPPETTITSYPQNPTNSTSATFTFASTEPDSTFECEIDGGGYSTCTSPKTYSGLSEGYHIFSVYAKDSAGNTDPTPARYSWRIDITPPETTIASYPQNPTNSISATFEFICNEEPCTFECQLDSGGWSFCESPKIYTGLSEGPHTFEVRAIDSAGNIDKTFANYTWTIDSIPPETTITSYPQNPTNSTSAKFEFTCDEGNCTFECKLDNETYSPCTSPKTYTNLSESSHTFYVRAIDSAGNTDPTPASYTWTVNLEKWVAITTIGAPSGRACHTAVWTGTEMIIWGGEANADVLNTGSRYDPSTDSWITATTIGAPSARTRHTAVWTGTEMIVWGGMSYPNSIPLASGGRYNPSTDSWTPITNTNAPSARYGHTAVWTGTEMIIWGGYYYDRTYYFFNTGGRYNPSADTWKPTTTTDAPSARGGHTAVWTGTEMIVWGGGDNNYIFNTGGRYNPSTDTWRATPTGLLGKTGHTAVWTGTEMIIWGGYDGSYSNSGWRYDPSTDTWTSITTTGAPSERVLHTAVWTGTEMIIWGGYDGSNGSTYFNTGGRYNPSTNTWKPTTTTDAPSPREYHTAVWTGTEMIVWGGYDGFNYLNTGGRYTP